MKSLRFPVFVGIIAGPAIALYVSTIPDAARAAGTGNANIVLVAQPAGAGQDLVQRVQDLLILLGYDPGPADGLIGDRTTRSVQTFQKQAGLTADGRISESLYLALLSSVETATRNAGRKSPAISAEAPVATTATPSTETVPSVTNGIANSSWTIIDSNGARASLTLLDNGKVGGVESPDFWRWQLSAGGIRISYNNKLGGWVNRRGRIVGEDELRGDANSSRGKRWTWTAKRIK